MTDYIREKGLLTGPEIDFIWEEIPKEIVLWQHAHAEGKIINEWASFFDLLDHQCDQLNLKDANAT